MPLRIGSGVPAGIGFTSKASGVAIGDNVVFRSGAAPPAPTVLLSETLNSVVIAANRAWGVFGGLTWSFTHGGRTYQIGSWFTDQNGLQIRFQDNATAQAFIAADFLINHAIPGADPIRSSAMSHISVIRAARTGPSFTGRYADATAYAVSITT